MFVNVVSTTVKCGTADIAMLDHVDRKLLKVIFSSHAKTASEFFYLETSALPLKYIIASMRIMYLQNILNREKAELSNE